MLIAAAVQGKWSNYLTLTVPASATEALQQVAFTQIQGLEAIRFNSQESFAFEGKGETANKLARRGQKLGITLANRENQPQTVIVTFDQPVAPGKTITIGLKPFRNPMYDSVYQFQVQTLSTYNPIIGTARLQFYGVDAYELLRRFEFMEVYFCWPRFGAIFFW
ncbi:DUF2808 domain-containing protein [Nostoc sp. NZL]|uniref:DUF2808 domain-containing protein n=1 Tax=Nostoc sp. NZL TaxID=2650612 RepID=UPI001E33E885|nr:DUF2808 domain-containing protein [Nostoc sp. NZL]